MNVLFPSSCLLTRGVFILAPKKKGLHAVKSNTLGAFWVKSFFNLSLQELDFRMHRSPLLQLHIYILKQNL